MIIATLIRFVLTFDQERNGST